MPANIHQKTGIAYGVIDARKTPYLYDEIISNGVNETLEACETQVRLGLRSEIADFDAADAFIMVPVGLDDDATYSSKSSIIYEWFTGMLARATEMRRGDRELTSAVEAAVELVDVDSGTFDIEEVVAAVFEDMQQTEYFNGSGEDRYGYSDGKFKYILDHLGGAPLIWVLESPFVTYCRTCSPCVMNAGDLDNCTSADEGNNVAYCVDPGDIEDEDDKPIEVHYVDTEGNIGVVSYKKDTTA